MTDQSTTPEPGDRVIRTRDDLAAALADIFLANADAGADEDNDRLVEEIAKRRRT